MIEWWGPVIVEYYSGSEGNGFTIIDSANWLTHKGSVGQAIIGEPRILDENGEVLGPGEVGDVYFANSRPFEYFDEPEKTKKAFNEQGWSTMGDMGYLDKDGFLYLTDRKNFTIITGGVNVYPAEIEGLLIAHDKVADVAVFGIPHTEFGEEVMAVVQPLDWSDANDETEAELIDGCENVSRRSRCRGRLTSSSNSPGWIMANSTNADFRMLIAQRGNVGCQAVTFSGDLYARHWTSG